MIRPIIRRLAVQQVSRDVPSRSAHYIAPATTNNGLRVSELLTTPDLVRLGAPQTPRLDHVPHRLMPGVSARDVDVEEQDGKLFVSGGVLVTQRSAQSVPFPQIAGVSTSHGSVPAFALASALARPEKAALWSLKAGSRIPDQLTVRVDPFEPTHVLWAPRQRMELSAYQTALASVGCDATGAPRDWTCWSDPLALLESLPMADADKKALQATVEVQLRTWRQHPSTRAAFVARALLGFLAGVAELATVISEDPDQYVSFAAACRRVVEHGAESGLSEPAEVAMAPALSKGLSARYFFPPSPHHDA